MRKRIYIIAITALLACIPAFSFVAFSGEDDVEVTENKQTKEEKAQARQDARAEKQRNKKARTARQKLKKLKTENTEAGLSLTKDDATVKEYENIGDMSKYRDTIKIKDIMTGRDVIMMRAIKDDETGDMVANEVLDAAVVTARFRNVAERHGKINLSWDIIIPPEMLDTKWQIRIFPEMHIMDRIENLEPIYITGKQYRKTQIKGYQRYADFLKGIITDATLFIDIQQLEYFLQRNIPKLYALKDSDEYVSDEEFASIYGVTEKEAVNHYVNKALVRRNNRRQARKDAKYHKYVKVPIDSLGLRLDSVIVNSDGKFCYCYTETIQTERNLKKVDIYLQGDIYDQDKRIYSIPKGDPLTFYIASLSAFVDKTPKYLYEVIERHAEANAEYNIQFEAAKANVKPELGNNAAELHNIKTDIAHILDNDTYILDSIVVRSYASPEGSVAINNKYCDLRSQSVGKYFGGFVRRYRDSLRTERGLSYVVDDSGQTSKTAGEEIGEVKFMYIHGGENWTMLDNLVEMDKTLTDEDKEDYFKYSGIRNLDEREMKFRNKKYYPHLRNNLYPLTRNVRFNFHLHRKGMTKDTLMSKVLDTLYMRGVQALADRDYETAVKILRPYQDYNAAVAFTALDYNISALAILEKLEPTAQSEYMLALIYSRQGDDQNAVQHYLYAVKLEPSYRHRGNLDPEIKVLIERYALFKDEDADLDLDLGF